MKSETDNFKPSMFKSQLENGKNVKNLIRNLPSRHINKCSLCTVFRTFKLPVYSSAQNWLPCIFCHALSYSVPTSILFHKYMTCIFLFTNRQGDRRKSFQKKHIHVFGYFVCPLLPSPPPFPSFMLMENLLRVWYMYKHRAYNHPSNQWCCSVFAHSASELFLWESSILFGGWEAGENYNKDNCWFCAL